MSYSEDQLWDLLGQVYNLPYGSAQIALVEQVVAHADAASLNELAFAARMQATTSYVYGGEPARAIVTFSWCLAEFDRDPRTHERHYSSLLWHFKYMISALTRFPEVPLERTYAVLDDMERRWRDTGHTLQAVYAHRHYVARHIGDLDTADEYYTKWCTTPRDDLSDCVGCDPSSKAWWLASRGRDEEAVALGEPVLAGTLTCSEQPQGILTNLLFPYVRTGRLDQARDAHRRAYRLHRPNLADLGDVADHIEFCALTGNEARGVEILERHLGWLDRAPSPYSAMSFAAAGSLVLRRAVRERSDLSLHRPEHGDRSAADVPAGQLADELAATALGIAERFDARNQTNRISTVTRSTLDAEPLVERLPLSPTATRPRPVLPEPTAAEPSGPPPTTTDDAVSLVDAAGPDEALELIEQGRRLDKDTGPALDAFDARYPTDDLTRAQRARRADARGIRLADKNDLAGAESLWRLAADDYAAVGQAKREQQCRAHIAVVLVRNGQLDEGLRLAADAGERLLAEAEVDTRLDAAGRWAWCLGLADRSEEAVAVLDRVAVDAPSGSARSRAMYGVQRQAALLAAGRVDEALALIEETVATATESGSRRLVARAHGSAFAALETDGQLDSAADHMTQAIALTDEPEMIRGMRFVRGNLLARTERAAESLDDLTETVADRTAAGDADGAADARHWLAVAYLNLDRLLDAAEVAEEELAHRLASSIVDGVPSASVQARYLLSTIYQRLEQPDEAIAQLEAIGRDCERIGNVAGLGQMHQEIADLLDQLDRDDSAAEGYRAAAEAYFSVGRPVETLYNRRRQARSAFWAHGPDAAEPLFEEAAAFGAELPADIGPALTFQLAMLDHDAARMYWAAQRPDEAVRRAQASADAFRSIDHLGGASDADVLRAEILLDDDQAPAAEAAARLALEQVPPGGTNTRIIGVLAASLEAQGRGDEARVIRESTPNRR